MSTQTSRIDRSALEGLAGKTILVTGAGGFIGSAVTEVLASSSARVHALLGLPGERLWEPSHCVETCRGDIRDLDALSDFTKGAEIVVHAAGPPSVKESFADPRHYASIHTVGTVTVMEACRRSGVRRVVYLSSAEVYGQPSTNSVAESHAIRPLSPYGAAKAAAEIFIQTIANASKMDYCILRPFSIFGPRQPAGSLIDTLLRQIRQGDCIWLNDLRPVRDYCYARDVAEAIALACIVDAKQCTVNIASGKGTSAQEIAELVLHLQGRDIPVREKARSDRPRSADVYHLIADITKARTLLGWQPRTSLAEGLMETIAWMKQRDSW